jgi:hypothetical protein
LALHGVAYQLEGRAAPSGAIGEIPANNRID